MTSQDFERLKDFFLSKNTYFDNGIANAFKDEESGNIFARKGNDFMSVFPNDTLGNYFYLRNEGFLSFKEDVKAKVTDNGPARMSFVDTAIVNVIAVVKDADAYALISNIRNSALMFKGFDIVPVAANWLRESVVITELSPAEDEEILAVLQSLKNETIVSVTLNCIMQYIPSSCINNNPCKTC